MNFCLQAYTISMRRGMCIVDGTVFEVLFTIVYISTVRLSMCIVDGTVLEVLSPCVPRQNPQLSFPWTAFSTIDRIPLVQEQSRSIQTIKTQRLRSPVLAHDPNYTPER